MTSDLFQYCTRCGGELSPDEREMARRLVEEDTIAPMCRNCLVAWIQDVVTGVQESTLPLIREFSNALLDVCKPISEAMHTSISEQNPQEKSDE